jgi:hypothetical protein
MESDPLWMKSVIVLVPAVTAPLVAWLTSLRTTSRRSSELDFLLRRIDLVERVQKVQGQSDATNRLVLDAELQDIFADLTLLRVGVHPSGTIPSPHSGWRGWFLAYKQSSRKGAVYKALFYLFVAIGIIGGIGLLIPPVWDTDPSAPSHFEQGVIGFLGVAVYLFIGLAFRYAAVRDYHKTAQKRSSQSPATAAG